MSSSSSSSPSSGNGHLHPLLAPVVEVDSGDRLSDSDLSDAHDTVHDTVDVAVASSRSSSSDPNDITNHTVNDGLDSQESDVNSDANASDDADFDMDDEAASIQSDPGEDDRSTSQESRRAPKRKSVIEDEFMKANPELYGLRRSVSLVIYTSFFTVLIVLRSLVRRNLEEWFVLSVD
jgi:chromodomain-helicase-DNA-binding protein 1